MLEHTFPRSGEVPAFETVSQSTGEADRDRLEWLDNQVRPGTPASPAGPPPSGRCARPSAPQSPPPLSLPLIALPKDPGVRLRSGASVAASRRGEGKRREPGTGVEAPAGLGCRRRLPEQLSGACSGERSQGWASLAQAPPPSPGPPPPPCPLPLLAALRPRPFPPSPLGCPTVPPLPRLAPPTSPALPSAPPHLRAQPPR